MDSNFQLECLKIEFRAFSSRRSSLTQTFVISCVDFEVAHLSILMVRRLPHPKIPTLRHVRCTETFVQHISNWFITTVFTRPLPLGF